ncbi:MAG: hypothetical protein IKM28_01005 [Lachnospiraceae bacterium]|nr:hypothetical protein [Lachnospiraceae bacterium]
MRECCLTLLPYGRQPFSICLSLQEDESSREVMRELPADSPGIFSDLSYELLLNDNESSAIQEVQVYVNDMYEPSIFHQGKICFPGSKISDRRIFLDCYGFVKLRLIFIREDGSQSHFCSDYLPVLVKQGQLNESVKAMVSYVYQHQELLFLEGGRIKNPSDFREGNHRKQNKNLADYLLLAEEIADVYEKSYGYFKENCRSYLEKTAVIESMERLHTITPETLRYLAVHPEQLKLTGINGGIRTSGRFYQPQKALSVQNIPSYSIEENRVILGFLQKMVREVSLLQEECILLLQQTPEYTHNDFEYLSSFVVMFTETRKGLEDRIRQLSRLYQQFLKVRESYQYILQIPVEQLFHIPQPTPVFRTVSPYYNIFIQIRRWFYLGNYDFAKERYMLSFRNISSLYESYLLLRIIEYLTKQGYTCDEARQCIYPVSERWKYKNTDGKNTFCFSDTRKQITLYYQPVIFDTDCSSVNGIGLYRNNSIPAFIHGEEQYSGGHYYVPDYLVKITEAGVSNYLVIDAKFSEIKNIKRYYLKDLVFKYLFSISPVSEKDRIAGLCIIYGKCTGQEKRQSVYNRCLPGHTIQPFAEILPLMEGVGTEAAEDKLDLVLGRFLTESGKSPISNIQSTNTSFDVLGL